MTRDEDFIFTIFIVTLDGLAGPIRLDLNLSSTKGLAGCQLQFLAHPGVRLKALETTLRAGLG